MARVAEEGVRALGLLEASLALDDRSAIAHLQAGCVLEELGRPLEGLAELRAAAWCNPSEPGLRSALERCCHTLERPHMVSAVFAEVRFEHRLIVATSRELRLQRNDYYAPRRAALESAYRALAAQVPSGEVLEWDCGTGIGCYWMAQTGRRVTGICGTTAELEYTRAYHPHALVQYEERELPAREFSLVVARNPVAPAWRAAELGRQVAPGGALVVPSTWSQVGLQRKFVRGTPLPEMLRDMPGCTQQLVMWRRRR